MNNSARLKLITEIAVDKMFFQVTENPFEKGSCILWLADAETASEYTALGKFSHFDKRKVLEFITRYVTNHRLRAQIAGRRFEVRIENLSEYHIRRLELKSRYDRKSAYMELFDLSGEINKEDLSRKMRMLAMKFHPDRGGDTRSMVLINEAYEYLMKSSLNR